MSVTSLIGYRLAGDLFEAHVCSKGCTCDPCTCNPCNCGDGRADDLPAGPLWRLTGYRITEGQIQNVDVSSLTLVKLALTSGEGANDDWQEYLLIDNCVDDAQVTSLLEALEYHLLPGLVSSSGSPLPTYLAPLAYLKKDDQRSQLQLQFLNDYIFPVGETYSLPQREWTYQRHVALQTFFYFAE